MNTETSNFHTFVLDYIEKFKYNPHIYSQFDIPKVFLYDWSWNNAEELFLVWWKYLQENLLWDHEMPTSVLRTIRNHSKYNKIRFALQWSYKLEELYNCK